MEYSKISIKSLLVDNKKYDVKNWEEVYLKIFDFLSYKFSANLILIASSSDDSILATTKEKLLLGEKLKNGMYLNMYLEEEVRIKNIIWILEKCRVDVERIKIEYEHKSYDYDFKDKKSTRYVNNNKVVTVMKENKANYIKRNYENTDESSVNEIIGSINNNKCDKVKKNKVSIKKKKIYEIKNKVNNEIRAHSYIKTNEVLSLLQEDKTIKKGAYFRILKKILGDDFFCTENLITSKSNIKNESDIILDYLDQKNSIRFIDIKNKIKTVFGDINTKEIESRILEKYYKVSSDFLNGEKDKESYTLYEKNKLTFDVDKFDDYFYSIWNSDIVKYETLTNGTLERIPKASVCWNSLTLEIYFRDYSKAFEIDTKYKIIKYKTVNNNELPEYTGENLVGTDIDIDTDIDNDLEYFYEILKIHFKDGIVLDNEGKKEFARLYEETYNIKCKSYRIELMISRQSIKLYKGYIAIENLIRNEDIETLYTKILEECEHNLKQKFPYKYIYDRLRCYNFMENIASSYVLQKVMESTLKEKLILNEYNFKIKKKGNKNKFREVNKFQEVEKIKTIEISPEREKKIYEIFKTFEKGISNKGLNIKKLNKKYEKHYGVREDEIFLEYVMKSKGIFIDGKKYIAKENLITRGELELLKKYIDDTFLSYNTYIYYSRLFEMINNITKSSFTGRITTKETLKTLLATELGNEYTFNEGYITPKNQKEEDINTSTLEEIEKIIFENTEPMKVEQISKEMPNLEIEKIETILDDSKKIVKFNNKRKFHIENFVYENKDLEKIKDIVNKSIKEKGYIIKKDLFVKLKKQGIDIVYDNENMITENDIFKVIRDLLGTDFESNNISISKKGVKVSGVNIMLKEYENETIIHIDELFKNFTSIVGGNSDRAILKRFREKYFQVDENTLHKVENINVNVREVDKLLDERIGENKEIFLGEITSYSLFPSIQYKWNHYCLMSYCNHFSKKYKFTTDAETKKPTGVIIKKDDIRTYKEVVKDIIIEKEKEGLTEEEIKEWLYENSITVKNPKLSTYKK